MPEKIDLDETSTAFQIVQKGMELGKHCFKEMLPRFLDERINGIKNGKEDYFPLMAELGRIFEHTKVMEKHVYPAIQESIHPDVLTYAFAFMVLF